MDIDLMAGRVDEALAAYAMHGMSTDDLCVVIHPALCEAFSAKELYERVRTPVLIVGTAPMDSLILMHVDAIEDLIVQSNELAKAMQSGRG